MAYNKTTYVNGGPPPISAENLNNIENEMEKVSDGLIEFDPTAPVGTVDGDLYAAIHALGWDDVIV